MSKKITSINVTANVEVPRVPNFVCIGGERWLPLCAFSPDGLKQLGEAWTKSLIQRAEEQSKNADEFYTKARKE